MDIISVNGDNEHNVCKDHSARKQKDHYKIYPSKLSKKELEDVYYSLIDNNLLLKKTINTQRDQIKLLSTKINRITTQKNIYGPHKACCKVVLSEHMDVILDLKQVNEKLRERIRQLNMQLCSAKQFVKSPLQVSKCQNCMNIRNSTSPLNAKRSQVALRMRSTSSQYLLQDVTLLTLEDTCKDSVTEPAECTQNKCKVTTEELQKNVDNLQKELVKSREEIRKLTDLEGDVSGLREDLQRARTRARAAEDELVLQKGRYQELLRGTRSVEAQNESISLELALERQQVRLLQTELRAEVASRRIHALSHATRTYHELVALETGVVEATREPFSVPADETSDASHAPVRRAEALQEAVELTDGPAGPADETAAESHRPMFEVASQQTEYGGGDTKVQEIDTIVPGSEETNIKREQRSKRKERHRRARGNSSEERRSTGDVSNFPQSTGKQETTENMTEDLGSVTERVPTRIYRDVAVQSAGTQLASRGVGEEATRAKDAGVQIGSSLRGKIDMDSRKSKSRTYSVDRRRAGDTEGEMSSLSDLPSERDSLPSDYISPGEQVSSSLSETISDCLSEGELPALGSHRSCGEVHARGVAEKDTTTSPSVRVQRAMRDVQRELTRCARLLGDAPAAACRSRGAAHGVHARGAS